MTILNEHSIDSNDIQEEYNRAVRAFEEARIKDMTFSQINEYTRQKAFKNNNN